MELRFGQHVSHAGKDKLALGALRVPPPWVIKKIEENEKKKRPPLVDDQPRVEIDDRVPPGYMPSEPEPSEQGKRGVEIIQL